MEKEHVVITLETFKKMESDIEVEKNKTAEAEKSQLELVKILIKVIKSGSQMLFSPHPNISNMHQLFTDAGYSIVCEMNNYETIQCGRGEKIVKLKVK